ncbi:MAG: ferrous iron transport protein A [Elusimicrobia bacterium]|nr:ferrous iron transport protein A [Elusimicrobiota bacterium]
MKTKKLSDLALGEEGVVCDVQAEPEVADQWLELGLGLGEIVSMEGRSPFGDPIVVGLMNYRLSLRKRDAEKILLRDVQTKSMGRE